MPLFICQKCNCIENTACGHYWTKDMVPCWRDSTLDGLALCSECSPSVFHDGSPNRHGGKWHGHFPKEFATPERIAEIGRENFIDLRGEPTPVPKKKRKR